MEGAPIEAGARVLLLDDVISTGGSKVDAIEITRERGAEPGEPFMSAPVLSLLS